MMSFESQSRDSWREYVLERRHGDGALDAWKYPVEGRVSLATSIHCEGVHSSRLTVYVGMQASHMASADFRIMAVGLKV